MFKTLINALKVQDIRRRLLYTFFILVVVRLGSLITVPGISAAAIKEYMQNALGDSLNIFSSFTGGSFEQMSIFALSVTPYITASIIIQLLTIAIPALEELQKVIDIKTLGDLSEEAFERYKSAIKSEVRQRRAKHAVYENQRTIKAVKALKAGDIEEFGRLMVASDTSLREDYEVTGKELDTLVAAALKQPGVIGSRMTGAGFGGCTVSIVKTDAVDNFIEKVGKEYKDTIGYAADFYVADIGGGPVVL